MTLYEYRCPQCGNAISSFTRDNRLMHECTVCGEDVEHKRVFSVNVWRPIHEHYNPTTGQVVSDLKQFKDQLKAESEEVTLRTGIEHNFEPVDPDHGKEKVLATDGKGLEATNRVRHQEGKRTIEL